MAKLISRAKPPILQPLPISQEPVPFDLLVREQNDKRTEIKSLQGLLGNIRDPKPGDRSAAAAELEIFKRQCEEALMLAQIDMECVAQEIGERLLLDPPPSAA
jgi:hypothetical protein